MLFRSQNDKLVKIFTEKVVNKYTKADLKILCDTLSLIGDLMMEEDYN